MLIKFNKFAFAFLISFMIVSSSTFALPSRTKKVDIAVFPSASPLSKKYEEGVYTNFDPKKISEFGDIYLAFKNRDKAWAKADDILNGIRTGKTNIENINNYTDKEIINITSVNKRAIKFTLNEIRALGDKTKLSTQYIKDIPPDYMIIEKLEGSKNIYIAVIKKIKNENKIVKISLSAKYPYEQWLVAGMHVTKFYKVSW